MDRTRKIPCKMQMTKLFLFRAVVFLINIFTFLGQLFLASCLRDLSDQVNRFHKNSILVHGMPDQYNLFILSLGYSCLLPAIWMIYVRNRLNSHTLLSLCIYPYIVMIICIYLFALASFGWIKSSLFI
jgi:hypothetical protein